jgi:uncharacterized repeat protein (TIGR03803 family)
MATLSTLVSFNGADGNFSLGNLIVDANGDLLGTTNGGGAAGDGTVFEIAKTSTGYSSAPATLVSFNGADGANSNAGLIADANGDLFGTTSGGGAIGDGTVFEIKNAGTALNPFNLTAYGGLLLFNGTDAAGTVGLWAYDGASGFQLTPIAGSASTGVDPYSMLSLAASTLVVTGSILSQNTDGQAAIWELRGTNVVGGGGVSPNPGPAWKAIGTGDFNHDGHSDILWRNTSGQVAIWEMNGTSIAGGGVVSANPGPTWKAVGTGDFNDDGPSDILLQSASGQVAIWEMNGPNLLGGGTLSADPGPSWQAIGTGGEGSSDILFQNMGTGQAALWDMKRNRHRRRGRREPQCRAELEGSAADLTDRGNSRATTRPGRSNAHGLKRRLLGRDPRTPCIEQDGQDQLKQS